VKTDKQGSSKAEEKHPKSLSTISSLEKETSSKRRIGTTPHTKQLLERNRKAIAELKSYVK
jgi:hypothetical protein